MNNDQELDPFRKMIREELRNESELGKGTFQERLRAELRLTGIVLAAMAIILIPAFFYLKHLLNSDVAGELSNLFVPWLFSCLGSQCP
jgi:type VI protein secretion system component VasF